MCPWAHLRRVCVLSCWALRPLSATWVWLVCRFLICIIFIFLPFVPPVAREEAQSSTELWICPLLPLDWIGFSTWGLVLLSTFVLYSSVTPALTFLFFVMLGIEPTASAKLDKCSVTKPQPWLCSGFLNWCNAYCFVFQFIIYLAWSFASVSPISPAKAQFSVEAWVFKSRPRPHPTQWGLVIPGDTCAFRNQGGDKTLSLNSCPPKTSILQEA